MTLTKEFFTAGNAIFTVTSVTGEYYTYLIRKIETSSRYPEAYFVYLLTGPDNTADYTYLGVVNKQTGDVRTTTKSKFNSQSKCVRVIDWALNLIWNDKQLPAGYSVRHIGKCGRCGRPLTCPQSLDTGLGPVCSEKAND